jgi:hypothetical protein
MDARARSRLSKAVREATGIEIEATDGQMTDLHGRRSDRNTEPFEPSRSKRGESTLPTGSELVGPEVGSPTAGS